MIKLYHAQFTRSIRILWLLEELGIPYELATVAFKPPRHSFEQATPTGKFPAIEDDGLVLFESGAILEYLIEKYETGDWRRPSAAPTVARIFSGCISPKRQRSRRLATSPAIPCSFPRPSAFRRLPTTVASAPRTRSPCSSTGSPARSIWSAESSPAPTS
jgi:hypothetical protein